MLRICLYLHIHQPFRIRNYSIFDIGKNSNYFLDKETDSQSNKNIFKKVFEKSYFPTFNILKKLLIEQPNFCFSLSISGTFIDQAKFYCPEALDIINELVETNKVTLIADTYNHSLAFFYSRKEFENQVNKHQMEIQKLFGKKTTVFRNTELAYNNELGQWADKKGFKVIFAEGWDPILKWRSPNFVYKPPNTNNIKLLVKNYRLSDDIAFRFSDKKWSSWPLTTEKYTEWIKKHVGNSEVINLFMDFETFGEHQWSDTGIFDFLQKLPEQINSTKDIIFSSPLEIAEYLEPKDILDMPEIVTWADSERDLSAWTGNDMQKIAIKKIYDLEKKINKISDPEITKDWERLQTSDHFYYMCTKWWADGDVHAYFSPYSSPYEAYGTFMNALSDLELRIHGKKFNSR